MFGFQCICYLQSFFRVESDTVWVFEAPFQCTVSVEKASVKRCAGNALKAIPVPKSRIDTKTMKTIDQISHQGVIFSETPASILDLLVAFPGVSKYFQVTNPSTLFGK